MMVTCRHRDDMQNGPSVGWRADAVPLQRFINRCRDLDEDRLAFGAGPVGAVQHPVGFKLAAGPKRGIRVTAPPSASARDDQSDDATVALQVASSFA